MLQLHSKKISWIILILLFTFDDIVSYFAVTKMHGKEANLIIAPYVEKYPLLYFACIPTTIFIIFLIEKLLTKTACRIFKKRGIEESVMEKIILFSIVIYWALANFLPNLIFILGFRISFHAVWLMNNLAILSAIIYVFLELNLISKKKSPSANLKL